MEPVFTTAAHKKILKKLGTFSTANALALSWFKLLQIWTMLGWQTSIGV